MASLGELSIELGFAGNTEQLEKFNKKIKEVAQNMDLSLKSAIKADTGVANFVKGAGKFAGFIAAAADVINNFTNDLVAGNQAMLDLTSTTDIAQSTFRKWGSIGQMLGVQNAEQQLESLNKKLVELNLTGEGARDFQLAGINPTGQDAEGILEQLRARISGLNNAKAAHLLQRLGIDPKMLHLLRISRNDFEALGETVSKYQLTDDLTEHIQSLNIQLQIAGIRLKYLKDKAIMTIMPAWTQFMASLARVGEGLSKAVQYVSDFISKSPAMQNALKGIAVAMGVILAITHPLWAAFAALYLVIDDVMAYFNGGRSLLGVLLYALEDLNIDGILDAEMPEWLEALVKVIDFLNGNASKRAGIRLMEEAIREIDPGALKVKTPDGSYGYADLPPELLKNNTRGQITGGAAPIDYNVKVELPEWVHNMLKEVANPQKGYAGTLPNLDRMIMSPSGQRNLSYNTTSTDNRQINQNVSIQTSQPVFDIQNQLTYARNAMVAGWA